MAGVRRGARQWLCLALTLACLASAPARSQDGGAIERGVVVLLSSHQYGLPVSIATTTGVMNALKESGYAVTNLYVEHLDLTRAPSAEHRANEAQRLRVKLAGQKVQVVVIEGPQAMAFVAHEGRDLFPDATIVSMNTPDDNPLKGDPRKVINMPWEVDPAATLRVALELFPRTRRVFVVSGANDRVIPFLDTARKAFAPWAQTIEFEYAYTLTYDAMLARAAALPPDSLIFYAPCFADAAGRPLVPIDVLNRVTEVAHAPVFAMLESYLGHGIVGGMLYRADDQGRRAATIALDSLAGRFDAAQATAHYAIPLVPRFDWAALQRWGADLSRLPPEAIFINRPPTLWGQYRTEVLTAGLVIALLSGLIVAQLATNRRLSRARAAASESEANLQQAQEIARMGRWELTHATGRFTWSGAAQTLLDVEALGGSAGFAAYLALVHPDDRDAVARAWAGALTHQATFESEHRLQPRGGRSAWVSQIGRTVFDATNRPLRTIGTLQDITERKEAEQQRASLEAQLRQSQKLESVGQLAGGVAHDFNNMLGVILGHAEMALETVDRASPLHEDLTEILEAARRSSELTRQLLAFARRQPVTPRVLDLERTVTGVLKMLHRLIGEHIELTWRPAASTWPVKMDPSQLDQILTNLCVNARDAITGAGHIGIATENCTFDAAYCTEHPDFRPGDFVRLSVTDTGCGMDERTLAQIFDPFFTTKAVGRGTGLGLATVYGAVQQNHGFLHVESQPGQGTTFGIYLPRCPVESAATPGDAAPASALRGHETILLAEDEAALLQMTAQMLEAQGYTVLKAAAPHEAVRLAGTHPGLIELLVTDVVMPEMNGRDLATAVRALRPDIKVLFVSGYTADIIAAQGAVEAGVAVLPKPFSRQELATKVRQVLEREEPPPA